MPDLYEAIGAERYMAQDALQRCYRARARATHPDHGGNEAAFKAAAAAWGVLGDPEARARYDATGEVPGEDPPPFDWLGALRGLFSPSQSAGVEPLAGALAGIAADASEAADCAGDVANIVDLVREVGMFGVEATLRPNEGDDAETVALKAGVLALGDWFRGGRGESPLAEEAPKPNRRERRAREKAGRASR